MSENMYDRMADAMEARRRRDEEKDKQKIAALESFRLSGDMKQDALRLQMIQEGLNPVAVQLELAPDQQADFEAKYTELDDDTVQEYLRYLRGAKLTFDLNQKPATDNPDRAEQMRLGIHIRRLFVHVIDQILARQPLPERAYTYDLTHTLIVPTLESYDKQDPTKTLALIDQLCRFEPTGEFYQDCERLFQLTEEPQAYNLIDKAQELSPDQYLELMRDRIESSLRQPCPEYVPLDTKDEDYEQKYYYFRLVPMLKVAAIEHILSQDENQRNIRAREVNPPEDNYEQKW